MPMIINLKFVLTNVMFPRKNPLKLVIITHVIPPITLYFVKVVVCMPLIPTVNGMSVLMMGIKCPRKTSALPWLAKNCLE